MLTITILKRALSVTGAVTAVCFALSAALGSEGRTDADESLAQQIANVTFTAMFAGLLLIVLLAVTCITVAVHDRRRR